MELVPTTISAGYAAGLNAYGTIFLSASSGARASGKCRTSSPPARS